MPTKCTKAFTLNSTDIMPLDQAVFAGGARNTIYGVRGGYVYSFDANGTKLASKRYTNGPSFGEASLAYDDLGDMLYAAFWNEGLDAGTGAPTNTAKGIWTINPNTLASTFLDINPMVTAGLAFPGPAIGPLNGPHQIICNAGKLMGTLIYTPVQSPSLITFQLNVPALTLDARTSQGLTTDSWWDVCWDLNLAAMWFTGNSFDGLLTDDFLGGSSGTLAFGTAEGPAGACQVNAAPFSLYATTRSKYLVKFASANLGAFTVFDLSSGNPSIATARPYRCRFNTADGLVYIPDPVTNSVITWNPVTDTVSAIKTGFDTPFDAVFTLTKKFAVQQGAAGLKEII